MTTPLAGKQGIPSSHGDSRDDLGYGRLTQKYFKKRVHGDPTFPYVEPPSDTEDAEVDDEAIAAVHDKLQEPRDYDPLPYADMEGQSLTGPNAHLGEATNALSPIPDLYKNRTRHGTGGTSPKYPHGPADGFSSRSKPTGSKQGYSTMVGFMPDDEAEEPAYSLEDIAEKQIEEIRAYIRLILLESQ